MWQVTYRIRFAISDDGFRLKPLNQGSHYSKVPWAGDDSQIEAFVKKQVSYIGNLKADGSKAGDTERTYGNFTAYKTANFDDLSLAV